MKFHKLLNILFLSFFLILPFLGHSKTNSPLWQWHEKELNILEKLLITGLNYRNFFSTFPNDNSHSSVISKITEELEGTFGLDENDTNTSIVSLENIYMILYALNKSLGEKDYFTSKKDIQSFLDLIKKIKLPDFKLIYININDKDNSKDYYLNTKIKLKRFNDNTDKNYVTITFSDVIIIQEYYRTKIKLKALIDYYDKLKNSFLELEKSKSILIEAKNIKKYNYFPDEVIEILEF